MNFIYKLLNIKTFDYQTAWNSFGITLLCLLGSALYSAFTAIYIYYSMWELCWFCAAQVFMCLLLFFCCRRGKFSIYLGSYILLTISVIAMHCMVTYYLGNTGSVFLLLATILPNHLFPLLKKNRYIITFDIIIILAINAIYIMGLKTVPVYAGESLDILKFLLLNTCLFICIFELFAHFFVQATLDAVYRKELENASSNAFKDELTGLNNRRILLNLKQELSEDHLKDPLKNHHLCVALFDIDFFKVINDTYGHLAGDEVLNAIANTMRSTFRKDDLLIRWGGEEFVIILRNIELAQAKPLIERFFNSLRNMKILLSNGETVNITVTIGVCEYDPQAPIEQAIDQADRLMYHGKVNGRNRIVYTS